MGHVYSGPRRIVSFSLLLITTSLIGNPSLAAASRPVDAPSSSLTSIAAPPTVLEDAHALAQAGDFHGAKEHYARAAREQRAAGILPEEAMWHLAQMYHGEGRIRKAAMTLEYLAWEAALAGEPMVQARALLEATLLYGQLPDADEVEQGVRRLVELCSGEQIPPELRVQIERRLNLAA